MSPFICEIFVFFLVHGYETLWIKTVFLNIILFKYIVHIMLTKCPNRLKKFFIWGPVFIMYITKDSVYFVYGLYLWIQHTAWIQFPLWAIIYSFYVVGLNTWSNRHLSIRHFGIRKELYPTCCPPPLNCGNDLWTQWQISRDSIWMNEKGWLPLLRYIW